MRFTLSLIVGILFASVAVSQDARTTIGVLTCTLADKAGKVTCGFKATASAAEEKYDGTVQGLAQPVVGKQVLVWSVVGPTDGKHVPGFLAQRYTRAKEISGQPPSWVGENNSAIVLLFETHGDAVLAKSINQVELKLSETSA